MYVLVYYNYTMIGLLDQNESLIDNKREIAELQEQISLMSVHILNKGEENEKYRDIIRGICVIILLTDRYIVSLVYRE